MAAAARAAGIDGKTLRRIAIKEGLWRPNQSRAGTARCSTEYSRIAIPLPAILRGEHPSYATGDLKRRLWREGCLKKECAVCRQGPHWNGKPLMLQLDHVNGDSCDHRFSNLRILCPNCHSQTATFAGRATRRTSQNTFELSKAVVSAELLAGATISQALKKANLSDSKAHYQSTHKLLAETPELQGCVAAIQYRPNRTVKTTRSRHAYFAEQHKLWLAGQQNRAALLREASFDFQRLGWATQVARLLDMPVQKVVPWIRKVDPAFLTKCKLRSTRA